MFAEMHDRFRIRLLGWDAGAWRTFCFLISISSPVKLKLDSPLEHLMDNQEFLGRLRQAVLQDIVSTAGKMLQIPELLPYSGPNSTTIDEDSIAFFESMMLTHWNSYHTGGTDRVLHGLNIFLKQLEKLA